MTAKFVVLLIIFVCYCNGENPLVKTPLGMVRGFFKNSHEGRQFAAFEGIPYAQPPIGNLRFEEPKPIEPWVGVWNATFVTVCAQVFAAVGNIQQGEEDCLYINVYVPRLDPNPEEKLDVVAHIHGGAFMFGSSYDYARPDFLIDRDFILVTFNYRVGIFGFLSTEDDVVPGNNGLKDQAVALRWIQDNIASFGGNPDSVTLTGLSSGGSSVHLHYLSEWSRGLFHRGFSQSGVALNFICIQVGALSKAQRLADAVDCPTRPNTILVRCLKQRPYRQLLDQVRLFYGHKYLPVAPFSFVVEKGSKPFLSSHPYYLLKKKKLVQDVPWVTSNTLHEGLLPLINFTNLQELNDNWESLAPLLLNFNYTVPERLWKRTSKKIKEFYLGKDQNMNQENYDKLIKMFSDRVHLTDTETAVRLHAEAANAPVYYYYFSYPGDNEARTVPHTADGRYIYGSVFPYNKALTPNELKMKDLFMDMLVSYAKTGAPLISGVQWKPIKDDILTYVNISGFVDGQVEAQTIDELAPHKFWTSLGFAENENLFSLKDEL